jgi:hypothetical protein
MKLAQTILSKLKACMKIARRFNAGIGFNLIPSPAGTAEAVRLIRSSLRDLNFFTMQPGVETPGYFHSPLWGWGTMQPYGLLKPAGVTVAPASWSAPVLWCFEHASHAMPKRQKTAAVQNLAEFRTPLGVTH